MGHEMTTWPDDKPDRGYFKNARTDGQPLFALPPGYDWTTQIEKYCSPGLLGRILARMRTVDHDGKLYDYIAAEPTAVDPDDESIPSADEIRTGAMTRSDTSLGRRSGYNEFSGVFCHRGLYDNARLIPENSVIAIEAGLEKGLHLHEIDVRLQTNADGSLSTRRAFVAHDSTADRVLGISPRMAETWSQRGARGAEIIGAPLVARRINMEDKDHPDFASSFLKTAAEVPGVESLLWQHYVANHAPVDGLSQARSPWQDREFNKNFYMNHGKTFQLDFLAPGDGFARFLAVNRDHRLQVSTSAGSLHVIIKGYNRDYPNGPALVEAVNNSPSYRLAAQVDTVQAHDAEVTTLACSGYDKMRMATGSRDKLVRIWESHTGKLLFTFEGHREKVTSVALSEKEDWVASGSVDRTVRVWNIKSGGLFRHFKDHGGPVQAVAFSPPSLDRETMVASGSDDHNVRIWEVESEKLLHTLNHGSQVSAVGFTTEDSGDRLVSASSGYGSIRFWNTTTGELIFTDNHGFVSSLSFSNFRVASGHTDDGSLRIWSTWRNAKVGYKLEHKLSHGVSITAVAFATTATSHAAKAHLHDRRVMSAGRDGSIKIWDVKDGTLVYVFQAHETCVTSLGFGAIRVTDTIMTGSREGQVRIWGYKSEVQTALSLKHPKPYKPHDRVIMVFDPEPIVKIALERKGWAVEGTTSEELLELLDLEYLTTTTRNHVMSFIMNPVPGYGQLICEIVHSGLGLGYNTLTGNAVNPKNGSPITDPEIIFAARLDRAMIDVSLELRERYRHMLFSSCTRLPDVIIGNKPFVVSAGDEDVANEDDDNEYFAQFRTGRMHKRQPGGPKIRGALRAIRGGMYPQSDLVVADDPYAEIAARTWIDEFAQLDRSQLMHMTYDQWIAQAAPNVREAVHLLNAGYLTNTVRLSTTHEETGNSRRSEDETLAVGPTLERQSYEALVVAAGMVADLRFEKPGDMAESVMGKPQLKKDGGIRKSWKTKWWPKEWW